MILVISCIYLGFLFFLDICHAFYELFSVLIFFIIFFIFYQIRTYLGDPAFVNTTGLLISVSEG